MNNTIFTDLGPGAAGDIEGVTAGDGLTGGGTAGTVTLNVGAGTGIDVAGSAVSVDVSDFMTNGADNRVLTATSADAMNGEANLTFDGSTLTVAGELAVNGATATFTSADEDDPTVKLVNNRNDTNSARIRFIKNKGGSGAAGADGDEIAELDFRGFNGAGSPTEESFARIKAKIEDPTDGAEGGELLLQVATAGSVQTGAKLLEGATGSGSIDVVLGRTATSVAETTGFLKVGANVIQASDGGATITMDTSDNVTIGNNLTVGGNIIQASDGGATITMDTNDNVTIGGDLAVNGRDITLANTGVGEIKVETTGVGTAGRNLTIAAGSAPTGSANLNGGNLILKAGDGDGTGSSAMQFFTKLNGTDAATERLRLHTNGNVGIDDTDPGTKLQITDDQPYITLKNNTAENTAGGCESKLIFEDHDNNALGQIEISHSGSADDTKGQFKLSVNDSSSLVEALKIDETRRATFTSTSTNSIVIDQDFAVTDASSIVGLDIDIDKTGGSTTNNSMIGINLDMDNTSATNGTNTMTGMKVTPTLVHAADAGTTLAKGIEVVVTGGTPGGSTARALDLTATGADFNQGIFMAIADGGPDIKMVSSADAGDNTTIAVGAAGATTITTTDSGGAAAHLRFDVDGDVEIEPAGDVIIKNTVNDANGARIKFVKDKGAAGADGDDIGVIEFIGDDSTQVQTSFAKIVAEVSEADNTDEAGKLSFFVAESDGTNTALTAGLVIEGEHATDGQVNVTLGAGVQSVTNTSGKLGVFDATPMTAINVVNNYNTVTFENQLASGEGGGRVMRYSPGADDTLTIGELYFLHSDGTWDSTDSSAIATGGTQLLGIGLGNARTAGCLMEGFIRIPAASIEGTPGSGAVDGLPLFVSETAGHITFTQPTTGSAFVRIVGHAIDDHSSDVLIYFNPSHNHVLL